MEGREWSARNRSWLECWPSSRQRVDGRKECLVYTEKRGRESSQVNFQVSQNKNAKLWTTFQQGPGVDAIHPWRKWARNLPWQNRETAGKIQHGAYENNQCFLIMQIEDEAHSHFKNKCIVVDQMSSSLFVRILTVSFYLSFGPLPFHQETKSYTMLQKYKQHTAIQICVQTDTFICPSAFIFLAPFGQKFGQCSIEALPLV